MKFKLLAGAPALLAATPATPATAQEVTTGFSCIYFGAAGGYDV